MLPYLLLFFVIVNLLISLNKRKDRIVILFTILFIVFCFTGTRDIADLHNYVDYYRNGYSGSAGQILFKLIIDIFKGLDFSFDMYRFSLSCIGLLFYYKFIIKYSPLPNLVFAAYLSYLMIMDDVQIRNFLGCSVLYLALIQLFEGKENWRVKYLLLVATASTIHTAFWVYLLFLMIPNDINKDRLVKIIGLGAVCFSLLVLFVRDYLTDFIYLFAFLDSDKLDRFALEPTKFGGALFGILQVFSILSIVYIKTKIDTHHMFNNKDNIIHFLQISLLINILSLCYVPAAIFSITFYRLVRNIFIVNLCAFSIGYKYLKRELSVIMIIIIYVGLYVYFDFTIDVNIETVLQPFFNNNIFFS